MKLIDHGTSYILIHPVAFALQVLKAFQANQGLLLAGAVAYYALLSIVPMLILTVIALSHFIEQDVLLATVAKALEYVVPGEARAVVLEMKSFMDHRVVVGWVLLLTMLFFSSLGFKVLENAISVIFLHRVELHKRHFIVSLHAKHTSDKVQIFCNGEVLPQRKLLRHVTDVFFYFHAVVKHIIAKAGALPTVRCKQTADHAYRCGFATAVGAQKTVNLTFIYLQCKIFHHVLVAKMLVDAAHINGQSHLKRTSTGRPGRRCVTSAATGVASTRNTSFSREPRL